MSGSTRTLLVAVLGQGAQRTDQAGASSGTLEEVARRVPAAVQAASDAGFEIVQHAMDPSDVQGTLESFKRQLQSRNFDGIVIGFQIRGNAEYTTLFEAAVNMGKDEAPQAKFLFSSAPDKLMEAIRRNFPDVK